MTRVFRILCKKVFLKIRVLYRMKIAVAGQTVKSKYLSALSNPCHSMEKTSSERKEFLHKRFSYWIANEKSIMKGMLISGEGE